MTDREKKIAEIRLEEIPKPDPVSSISQYAKQFGGTLTGEAFQDLFDVIDREREEKRKLREELETLKRLNRNMREDVDDAYQQLREERKQLQSAQQDREKLIEGLRWYADEENQKLDESTRHWENVYSPYEMDGGQRAREILKEIGVIE
ncbi:hypothetical protein PACILC2_34670 [Paenibacillus cisolokensis]|uniref:Uncharacterized protein n=1 Tax=Paenibacillus cisolokensis TaxID=1658519 RepID=A0ABQ4N9G8_9BACL|nr:hypothetical protein [Paenibacillus cisolokensis]GIQ64899.1 hypothetical protein PACILC2_34670 [Paenibacillus cisolokensis]